MIVSAFTTDDPRVALSHAVSDEERTKLDGVFCTADVNVTQAFIDFHDRQDADRPCRPYMHMIGDCVGLRGELPYDVRGLQFPDGHGLPVDIFYEFDDEQLADLVRKGLYTPGFKCPEVLYESTIYMPVYCDMMMIPPAKEDMPPIVFANIQYRNSIEVAVEDCGYDFAQFFERAEPEADNGLDFMDSIDLHDEFDFGRGMDKDAEPEGEHEMSLEEQMLREEYDGIHRKVVEDHIEPQQRHVEEARERFANDLSPELQSEAEAEGVSERQDGLDLESDAITFIDEQPEIDDDEDIVNGTDAEVGSEFHADEDDEFIEVEEDVTDEVAEEFGTTPQASVRREIRRNAVEDNAQANATDEVYDVDGDGIIDESDVEASAHVDEPRHARPRTVPSVLEGVVEAEHKQMAAEAQDTEDYSD